MKLRYNYRLNPTTKQVDLLKQVGGTCRWLWNYFLGQNIQEYKTNKKFKFYHEMATSLPKLKADHQWLKETYSQVLQQVLKDLDQALKFKKHGRGFPKFKKKYDQRDSFRYVQHTKIEGKYLHLPKIGAIKIRLHRALPKYTSVTIFQDQGHWYASFVVEKQEIQKPKPIDQVIGLEVNSKDFALNTGELIPNPKFLKQKREQVKGLQRKLARKQKGSNSRTRAKQRLGVLSRQIRNKRQNFLHQVSHRITKYGVLVCVETLKIEQMKKKKLIAKAIQDAGWGILFGLLKYKTNLRGGYFHKINQWIASSKTCNSCGYVKDDMDLSIRTYECEECGYTENRDINAAKNIATYGLQGFCLKNRDLIPPGQELPGTPLDVMWAVMSSDYISSATTMKEEATLL